MFILTVSVFAGGSVFGSEEDECIGARMIKDSGLAYYCLIVARAFTGINAPEAPRTSAPLAFETNLGQADRQFEFLAHSARGSVYLSKGGATLDLRDAKNAPGMLQAGFAGGNPNPQAVL